MKLYFLIGSWIQLGSCIVKGSQLHDRETEYVSSHSNDFKLLGVASLVCKTTKFNTGFRCLDDTDKWCFEDFGESRQPESPEEINVSFDLYKSSSSVDKITLSSDLDKVDGLKNFDATLPWKIIVHGWKMSGQDGGMTAIKDAFFKAEEKVNVIIVDWKDGADNFYCQSAANTRLVGKQIGMLVRKLEGHFKANIAERTHIIGYSLGGHTAGNAGMYLQRNPSQFAPSGPCAKLYRITGLDAAGPGFEGEDERLRLDPSDACYVDAIHSDGGKLGISMAVGHDDFYPNGGDIQPGCEFFGNRVASQKIPGMDVGCDHFRAVEYFNEYMYLFCKMVGLWRTRMRCESPK